MSTLGRRLLGFVAVSLAAAPSLPAKDVGLAGPPAPAPRLAASQAPAAPAPPLPAYLRDRGTGVATSMFGTYIRRGEFIVYPFLEYYKDHDFEYKPEELGYPGDVDYRGRFRASEGLLFVAYGLGENLELEMEAAVISASLEKSPDDTSSVPPKIEESGLGDVEGQLRWRFRREDERRPELFSYFEAVLPHAKEKVLIGTPGLELNLGVGIVKGFDWGTLTARAALEYSEASSSHYDLGEYAVEYLKRLSPRFRVYIGLEGTQDELSLITELQWHLGRHVFVRFNNGLGLTSKATDWSPEVGILFTLPTRRSPPADSR
jgi:hypothetical protein